MGLNREKREEVLWDLHQDTIEEEQAIPSFITNEINPSEFGLEPVKAKEMTSGLSTTISERQVLIEAYADVINLEINSENLPTFKELRLKIVKNRTQGIEKWHKTNKAFYLAGGRFVDAIKNKEVLINEEMECKLMEAEKFFENQEKEAKRLLNEKRLDRIMPYVIDVCGLDFSDMSDYDFDDYILGKKTRFENEQKERQAELLRIETERIAEIEKQKAIEAENAKLKAESEAKEIELQKERAKVDAERKIEADKQAKTQAEKDTQIKAEREAREKLEAELRAKKEVELQAEKRKKDLEAQQRENAEKLAKAPIKEQMTIWIDSFSIPELDVKNDKKLLIKEKFESFKKWAKKEIELI
jgi:hypothetical protein